jgi:hypothetical protein
MLLAEPVALLVALVGAGDVLFELAGGRNDNRV